MDMDNCLCVYLPLLPVIHKDDIQDRIQKSTASQNPSTVTTTRVHQQYKHSLPARKVLPNQHHRRRRTNDDDDDSNASIAVPFPFTPPHSPTTNSQILGGDVTNPVSNLPTPSNSYPQSTRYTTSHFM